MSHKANNAELLCSLSESELAERRKAIRSRILANTKRVTNTGNGIRLTFAFNAD